MVEYFQYGIYYFLIFRYKKQGEYYVKVMKKIQEKGGEYLSKEIGRLQRMLGMSNVFLTTVNKENSCLLHKKKLI